MSERWRQVKALFQAALDQDETRRQAFLDAECGADPDLRIRVEALLASHERAAAFLETPAIDRLPPDPAPAGWREGQRIGPYEVGALVGEGGMGTVHQATRVDDVFRKRVAIKVVKRGMDTESVLRRFHHERQTLASLDHPGIAKILDGGTTPDGLPYFVMEFVEGEPVDVYCERRRLGVLERLTLFRSICAAIQYAHQNLVVHRDIKPDNILVTDDDAPHPYVANLGDPAGAMDSYRRALALLESVPGADSSADTRREIAAVHERIGDIKAITGDVAGALDSQREALTRRQALAGADASDQLRAELADSFKKVAEALAWKGEAALALTHAREALRLREAIAQREPTAAAQAALASSLTNVGEMLVASGDAPSALEHFRNAVARATSASEREPANAQLRRQRAIALSKVGETLAAGGDVAGAATSHRAALAARRGLADADPANMQARRDQAISHIMLAETLQSGRDRGEALEHVQASLTIFERLSGEQRNASARTDLAEAHRMAGAIRLRAGDTAAAITSFERAIALAEGVTAGDAADVDTRRGIVSSYRRLGDAYAAAAQAATASTATRRGRWQDARRAYQRAHDLLLSIRAAVALTADDEGQIVATAQRIAASDDELNKLSDGREQQAPR
jgi:tetratricopeptide (TPR) repeat protein